MDHQFYSQREAAEYLGISFYALHHLRQQGKGPKVIKAGDGQSGRLIYTKSWLDRWLKTTDARPYRKNKEKVGTRDQ